MMPPGRPPQDAGRSPSRAWIPPDRPDLLPEPRAPVAVAVADAPAPAESMLADMLRRVLRRPDGRLVMALHLSTLSPLPRSYHLRVAQSIMQDAALRHDGQVFPLANGDIVLLCRVPREGDPAWLGDTLVHLFAGDARDAAGLLSIWRLDHESAAAKAYVEERLAAAPLCRPLAADPAADPQTVATAEAMARTARFADLMRRQTAIRLDPPRAGGPGRLPALRPLYRELAVSLAALERRIPAARQARSDPFLFRHLVTRLDEMVLQALLADLPAEAGLLAPDQASIPLHLNLSVAGILSDGFARFVEERPVALGVLAVEVSLLEACADPDRFAAARLRLQHANYRLVLDGIDHLTLMLASPAALQPDLLKLEWCPRLLRMPQAERQRIAHALSGIDPDRLVLDHVDSEAALHWGLSHGIHNFQGRHADTLQARARLGGCAQGRRCTVDECAGRAAATDLATRGTCHDLAVLDGSQAGPLFGPA